MKTQQRRSKLEGHEHWEAKTRDASTWRLCYLQWQEIVSFIFSGQQDHFVLLAICLGFFVGTVLDEIAGLHECPTRNSGIIVWFLDIFLRGISIPSINQHIAPSKQVSKITLRRLVAATSYTLSKFRQYPPPARHLGDFTEVFKSLINPNQPFFSKRLQSLGIYGGQPDQACLWCQDSVMPRKLTWNLKMEEMPILEIIIFRFHVCFGPLNSS